MLVVSGSLTLDLPTDQVILFDGLRTDSGCKEAEGVHEEAWNASS